MGLCPQKIFQKSTLKSRFLQPIHMYAVNRLQPTRFVYFAFEQSRSALFGALLLKFVLFEMHNYLRPVLLGAPLQLGALSMRLVRL